MSSPLLAKAVAALIVVVVVAGCTTEEAAAPPSTARPQVKVRASTTSTTGTTVSTTTSTSTTLPKFLVYRNTGDGFSIKYLSRWHRVDNYMGTVVLFLSLKERLGDPFQEHVNVVVYDYSNATKTLDEYTKTMLWQVRMYVADVEVLESGDATLAGQPGYRIVYTGSKGDSSFRWMQTWTMSDDKAYIITYTSTVDEYDAYLADVEEMIESFKII
jgi:hypothetical protein